jgi:hypothetical protein
LLYPQKSPIIAVNREILQNLTNYDWGSFPLTATEGYRHHRPTVRLERQEDGIVPAIHNYGHGGAGVTLSWSCAIRAASLAPANDLSAQQLELLPSANAAQLRSTTNS